MRPLFFGNEVNLGRSKNFTLVNHDLSHFLRWWILTQLFWKRGELMVNLDPTNFFKRWTEVKTEEGRFKVVFDGCIKAGLLLPFIYWLDSMRVWRQAYAGVGAYYWIHCLNISNDGTCTMDSSSAFYSGHVLVHVDMDSGLDETWAV